MSGQDEWRIEIRERYLMNRAGEGAREIEERRSAGKGRLRRKIERALDLRTDERSWRRGAVGERMLGSAGDS